MGKRDLELVEKDHGPLPAKTRMSGKKKRKGRFSNFWDPGETHVGVYCERTIPDSHKLYLSPGKLPYVRRTLNYLPFYHKHALENWTSQSKVY